MRCTLDERAEDSGPTAAEASRGRPEASPGVRALLSHRVGARLVGSLAEALSEALCATPPLERTRRCPTQQPTQQQPHARQ